MEYDNIVRVIILPTLRVTATNGIVVNNEVIRW